MKTNVKFDRNDFGNDLKMKGNHNRDEYEDFVTDDEVLDTLLYTSESVGEGHSDKMCDRISDAILDAHLQSDPDSMVACETIVKSGFIAVLGEITSKAEVDIEAVVRETVEKIGYDDESKGFDCRTCEIIIKIDKQDSQIALGVHQDREDEEIGAGDQGLMFGYATDETTESLPLTVVLAHKLNAKLAELRKNGIFWWARPSTKTQVTCEYYFEKGAAIPLRVHAVVVSIQHSDDISLETLRQEVMDKVIKEVIPAKYLDQRTIYYKWTSLGPQRGRWPTR